MALKIERSGFYSVHESDTECPGCWHSGPVTCSDCGQRTLHTEFGDENSDGDYWLVYHCTHCGSTDAPDDV